MMSRFLRNLIYRHSETRVGSDPGPVLKNLVQPRLRSRFETDSLAGSSTTAFDGLFETEAQYKDAAQLRAGRNPREEISKRANAEARMARPEVLARSTRLNHQAGAETSESQQSAHAERTPGSSQFAAGPDRSLPSRHEFSRRIRAIEDILHHSQSPVSDRSPVVAAERDVQAAVHAMKHPSGQAEPSDAQPGAATARPGIASASPGAVGLLRSGSQQLPAWLSEIGAEVQNIRQKHFGATPPEPTVNVSIGRVEIRAARTPTAKPSRTSDLKTGIMSLETYLERRNGRVS